MAKAVCPQSQGVLGSDATRGLRRACNQDDEEMTRGRSDASGSITARVGVVGVKRARAWSGGSTRRSQGSGQKSTVVERGCTRIGILGERFIVSFGYRGRDVLWNYRYRRCRGVRRHRASRLHARVVARTLRVRRRATISPPRTTSGQPSLVYFSPPRQCAICPRSVWRLTIRPHAGTFSLAPFLPFPRRRSSCSPRRA